MSAYLFNFCGNTNNIDNFHILFLEIPLFHVLNARITFGNINALDQPVDGITVIDDNGLQSCVVDETCFDPPRGYNRLGKLLWMPYLIHYDEVQNCRARSCEYIL